MRAWGLFHITFITHMLAKSRRCNLMELCISPIHFAFVIQYIPHLPPWRFSVEVTERDISGSCSILCPEAQTVTPWSNLWELEMGALGKYFCHIPRGMILGVFKKVAWNGGQLGEIFLHWFTLLLSLLSSSLLYGAAVLNKVFTCEPLPDVPLHGEPSSWLLRPGKVLESIEDASKH